MLAADKAILPTCYYFAFTSVAEDLATLHHELDALQLGDVFQGVTGHGDMSANLPLSIEPILSFHPIISALTIVRPELLSW